MSEDYAYSEEESSSSFDYSQQDYEENKQDLSEQELLGGEGHNSLDSKFNDIISKKNDPYKLMTYLDVFRKIST